MSTIQAITYEDAIAVTASDSAKDPAGPFAGFYTGSGGDITVVTSRGRTVLFKGTAAGLVVTCAILQVKVTGTAATNILGMLAPPYKGPGATS